MAENAAHPASFRDPSGFVFLHEGRHYRYVADSYADDYGQLMDSGLYHSLVGKGLLLPHEEVSKEGIGYPDAWKILVPEQLSHWSYPYEWSFAQLKEAAMLTLTLNLEGLKKGMILKDATAYNIQFHEGKAILIDSLSFERYEQGTAWAAFRQFCQHFLYPLLLQHYGTPFQPGWLMQYPDGVPAAVTKALLPGRSRFSIFNYLYVHLPAGISKAAEKSSARKLPANAVQNNLLYLQRVISKLAPKEQRSHWSAYYSTTILNDAYLAHKQEVIDGMLQRIKPDTVTDIGCNTGTFSLLAAKHAKQVVAFDNDPRSIHDLYSEARKQKVRNLLPLVASITDPTPATGWGNKEHSSLLSRAGSDTVFALALVHHLALTDNLPLGKILALMAELVGRYLVIEFVPKEDRMAQLLLKSKKDIFNRYTEKDFEEEAARYFDMEEKVSLQESPRILYLLRRKL